MYFDVSFHRDGMIIPVMGAGLGSVGKAQGGLVLQKFGANHGETWSTLS
jgi:hypothetical protein